MDINQVIISGNLTRDPELRKVGSRGTSLCTLGVAINKRWKDKNTGEMKQEATFVDVDVWGAEADKAAGQLAKGRGVCIVGELKLDRWEDRTTKQQRTKLKVKATNIIPAGDLAGVPRSQQPAAASQPGVHREMNEGEESFETNEDIPF
ncbi:MAG: single-stranded DNA-binding protein [Armatimonadia bacterium]